MMYWLRLFASLGAATLLTLTGCSDDPTQPAPIPLGDLDLSLQIDSGTDILISEAVTARVLVSGEESDILDDFLVSWGWRETGAMYVFDEAGRSELTVQFTAVGDQRLRVRVSEQRVENGPEPEEVLLEVPFTVRANDEDGSLEMVTVPAGPFLRGELDENTAFSWNSPQREIQISAFSMARTEMTNREVADLLTWAATRHTLATSPNPQFLIWKTDPEADSGVTLIDFSNSDLFLTGTDILVSQGRDRYPASGVYWQGAAAICNWLSERAGLPPTYTFTEANFNRYDVTCDFEASGYRLPTEAEWEKAARGGLTLNLEAGRQYPWGSDPMVFEIWQSNLVLGRVEIYGSTRANTAYSPLDVLNPFSGPLFGGSLPVASFPDGRSPYGFDDLMGNVSEWCWDWFGPGYYENSTDQDPTGTTDVFDFVDDFKIIRGDSWRGAYNPATDWWWNEDGCAKRRWSSRFYAAPDLGFRVVRSLR